MALPYINFLSCVSSKVKKEKEDLLINPIDIIYSMKGPTVTLLVQNIYLFFQKTRKKMPKSTL